MVYKRPVGTSEPWDFELKEAGAVKDLSDFESVELVISTERGNTVTPPSGTLPEVDFLEASDGTVRVTGVDNLSVGNYYVRFKLTDAVGSIFFVPSSEKADACDVWTITGIPKHPA